MMQRLTSLCIACCLFWNSFPLLAKEWDPQLLRASQLAYQGQVQEAESLMDTYIQAHPEDPNGLFVKAVVLDWKAAILGQPDKIAEGPILDLYKKANGLAFQNWHKDQENIDRLIDLGNSYLFLGRKYSEVGSWFKAVLTAKKCQVPLEKALKLDPTRVDGLLALGGFHYLADNIPPGAKIFRGLLGIRGNMVEGLAEIKRAAAGDYPFVNDARYALIAIYLDYEKNFEEALRMTEELVRQFPDNPELQLKLAVIKEKQDRAKGAEAYVNFAQWCGSDTKRCRAHYMFLAYYHGGHLYKELGQLTKAKDLLTQALNDDVHLSANKSAEVLYWLGQIDQAEGHFDLAVAKYHLAKSIPDISKNIKKKIEEDLAAASQSGNLPVKQ